MKKVRTTLSVNRFPTNGLLTAIPGARLPPSRQWRASSFYRSSHFISTLIFLVSDVVPASG